MNKLLIFDAEGGKLDRELVRKALLDVEGIGDFREGAFIGSVMDCEFDWASDKTLVRLSDDLETLSLTGVGDASLVLALEIRNRLPRPLRAVDLAYTFDIFLADVESLEDFRRIVDGA